MELLEVFLEHSIRVWNIEYSFCIGCHCARIPWATTGTDHIPFPIVDSRHSSYDCLILPDKD
jgi:hypothetical protein